MSTTPDVSGSLGAAVCARSRVGSRACGKGRADRGIPSRGAGDGHSFLHAASTHIGKLDMHEHPPALNKKVAPTTILHSCTCDP